MVLSIVPYQVRTLAFKDASTLAVNLDNYITGPSYEKAIGIYDLGSAVFNTGAGSVQTPPGKALEGHDKVVLSVAWSPSGDRLVSGGHQGDMTVRTWNYATATEISSTDALRPVTSVDWSSNNEIAYTTVRWLGANVLPNLSIIDQTGSPLQTEQGRLSWYSVDWAPDGNSLVTASEDFSARIWDTSLNLLLVLVAQKPDYALYVVGGDRYNQKDAKWEPGLQPATFYTWDDATGWTGIPLSATVADWPEKPQIEAFQIFGASQFIEFAIPRENMSNPTSMAVEMFSTFSNMSWPAQDSVPEDKNVFYMPEKTIPPGRERKDLVYLPIVTSLSTFTWKSIKYFYTDVAMSKSGQFHFGFHPSPHLTNQRGIVGV
ncbi:MAG: hypothetical protein KAW09_05160, partial [Thermoplasmata archaeon]|nr:hypothetical protein [Thermoplasmata archaeon]